MTTDNNKGLTEQEIELLLKIKDNPDLIRKRWLDKEKRDKLIKEIEQKIENTENQKFILQDIIRKIKEKFQKIDDDENNINLSWNIENFVINPLEKAVKKINNKYNDSYNNKWWDDFDLKPL